MKVGLWKLSEIDEGRVVATIREGELLSFRMIVALSMQNSRPLITSSLGRPSSVPISSKVSARLCR